MTSDERSILHDRVRSFIAQSTEGKTTSETFEALALAILAYQERNVPAYARLVSASGRSVRSASTPRSLPAVPTDAFRLIRIAAHPSREDQIVFRTSGTTFGTRGEHPLSTTRTYEESAIAWGRWALLFDTPPLALAAIVLGPPPGDPSTSDSSLHFMMRLFASKLCSSVRYVQSEAGLYGQLLKAACAGASSPTLVMGTSFAFVHALDELGGAKLPLPPGSRAMHTGGYKGRSREVEPPLLRAEIAGCFGMAEAAVVGEYGMTELGSQLYESTLRHAAGLPAPSARHGVFVPPPWLRVVSADPETLEPVASGEIGILRFEDLANVDSALAVQTADRGRCGEAGVELFGRQPGSVPRGCSLAIEELRDKS